MVKRKQIGDHLYWELGREARDLTWNSLTFELSRLLRELTHYSNSCTSLADITIENILDYNG